MSNPTKQTPQEKRYHVLTIDSQQAVLLSALLGKDLTNLQQATGVAEQDLQEKLAQAYSDNKLALVFDANSLSERLPNVQFSHVSSDFEDTDSKEDDKGDKGKQADQSSEK